jgi:hypothetical protein
MNSKNCCTSKSKRTKIMNTNWSPIPGFDGYYANRNGQISSNKTGKYKLLTIIGKTTQTVRITIKSNTSTHDVHKLVALAFHSNPDNYQYVRHINGESLDNRPENLEWVQEIPQYFSLRLCEEKMKAAVNNFHEWKPLTKYPGYFIHPDGMVMSTTSRVVNMKITKKPKPSIMMEDNTGERSLIQLAILLTETFIPNEMGYTEVEYIDGDVQNIRLSNLRWDVNSPTTLRDLKKEVQDKDMWRPVEKYPGYLVSKKGEVISCRTKHYVLMKPSAVDQQTTYRLRSDDGEGQPVIPLRQLIGLAFIPNPEGLPFVAVRNGDLSDLTTILKTCSGTGILKDIQKMGGK